METNLLSLYKEARGAQKIPYRGFITQDAAARALKLAREWLTDGKKSYRSQWEWQRGDYNVTRQPKEHASDNYAWIENTSSAGLRFVGYCDEIAGGAIGHEGWYTSEDNWSGVVYRGAVWQLPGRKGVARFIAGYADPNNEGAAFVDLDIVSDSDADDAKRDAALLADSIAERIAEREREYEEQWQAGSRWAELGDEISTTRQETLELLAEMREERKTRGATKPRICETLRADVARALRQISKMREERAQLFADYGETAGFADHLPQA